MKKLVYFCGIFAFMLLIVFSCQKQPQNAWQDVNQEVQSAPDGSAITPLPTTVLSDAQHTHKAGHLTIINFNDLVSGDPAPYDQYAAEGVYMYPSSDELYGIGAPCEGTVGLWTVPFSGPYFIFNFDGWINEVSIDAGDFGADSDEITLTAYSGLNETGDVLGSTTVTLAEYEGGCPTLSLYGLAVARSITVTSVSSLDGNDYPNSIYLDNLMFETTMAIDIKPGSYPNTINCNNDNALIPVAVLTTDDFDATMVDHTTVVFEGAMEWHKDKDGIAKRHEEDVDGDGDIDLVFHFKYAETTLDCESTYGSLTGETYDGVTFNGVDEVTMK